MLSKATEYAIRALVFIQLQNWKQRHPGVLEIAAEIGAPTAFTAKILHTLTRQQLLHSMKGRGGGFFFENNVSDLTLYRIIIMMEGDGLFNQCGIGLKNCSDQHPCPLHEEFIPIRNKLLQLAQAETIHSLAGKIRNGDAVLKRTQILGDGLNES